MKLLIKQRVFSWTDSYDVYDEQGEVRYFVKADLLSLGHRLHVYNAAGSEVGRIQEKVFRLLPEFEIIMDGAVKGTIQKKFAFFKPKYDISFHGWQAEGDFLGWNYDVWSACCVAVHITKEPLHWGDTYVIDYADPKDELAALMLAISIDAANCTEGN
ncbi:MAG: LURP-one-related/scramblase family protein [Butyricicoccus sp.]